jgi:hypothetical protein
MSLGEKLFNVKLSTGLAKLLRLNLIHHNCSILLLHRKNGTCGHFLLETLLRNLDHKKEAT